MHPKKLNIEFDNKSKPFDIITRTELLSEVLEGKWTSMYKGKGMEFSEFRQYVYGDDASTIDWKASRRTGKTLVKEYTQDKSAKILFVLDVSDSMLFSSRADGKMKVEYAAELVYKMSKSILKSGDSVGLIMTTDKIISKIKPNIGIAVVHKIKEELSKKENYGGQFDFVHTMKYLLNAAGQKLVIILITDFIGLKKGWEKYIQILNQKYDLIGIMIKDHRDRYLPTTGGQIVLEDPTTSEKIYVDAKKYAETYHYEVLREEKEIMTKFKGARSQILKLETTDNGLLKVVQFFNKRATLIQNRR